MTRSPINCKSARTATLLAVGVALVAALAACAHRPAPLPPPATVAEVDLQRYTGLWHEIARLPNIFQKPCTGAVTAEYSVLEDGKIGVLNSCIGKDGKVRQIRGTARVVPGSGNSRLKVRFFGPFEGDYWILALDQKSYRWALVGHPNRKFLWILSRESALDEATYNQIVKLAADAGFDTDKIAKTPQK